MKTTHVPRQLTRLRKALLGKTTAGLVAGLALLATQTMHAANGTWSGATNNSWATAGNWSSLPGSADTATFNTTPGSTVDLGGAAQSVKSILFDGSTGSFTFNTGGAGGKFVLATNGSITLAATATGTNLVQTFNTGLSLSGGYSLTNNSADVGSAIVVNGNITNTGTSTLNLSGTGTGTGNAINGVISDGTGVQSVTIIGTKWTLGNANSYTGKTVIGSAATNGGALVRVATLANGGSNSSIGASSSAATNLQFVNTSTLQYTGGTVVTDREFSVGVNTSMTIDVTNSGTNLTMKGDTGSALSNQVITKAGAGTLTFTGVQTYAGATTVTGGTLALDMDAGGAFASASALTLGGGTLEIKGANNAASTQTMGVLTLLANTNNTIKLTSGGGSGSVALTLGNAWGTRPNGSTLNIDLSSPGATLTSQPIASAASQSATSVVLAYATVTDAGGTGFATVINNNIVRYTAAGTLAASSSSSSNQYVTKVGDAGYSGNTLTLTSGLHRMASLQLDTSGGDGVLDLNGNVDANTLGTTLLVTGDNNFTIQNGQFGTGAGGTRETIIHTVGRGELTISATLGFSTNTSVFTKDGQGTLVLTAANPYTGATIINGGVLRATDGTGLPTVSLLTLSNGVFETNATAFTRTVGSAAGNVQVTGGKSGFSAYGGPVTVSLGGTGTETQLVWGSANFNPGVFVLNERTANNTLNLKNAIDLAGSTRTIAVNADSSHAATISGVISSSLSGGALTKDGTGTLILANSNTYTGQTTVKAGILAMGVNNAFSAGTNFNLAGGTFAVGTFSNNSVGTLVLTANSTITLGAGGVFAFANSSAIDWSNYSLSITGSFVDGSSIRFGTDASGLTGGQLAQILINGGAASLDASGYLVASAIPEPATYALLGGAVVLLGTGCVRRRRPVLA